MSKKIVHRTGFANLPAHADKRRLVAPVMRARGLKKWADVENRNVVGIAELATISRLYLRTVPGWSLVGAKFNNVFPGNRLNNALWFNTDVYTKCRVRHLRVPMDGRPRGLNMVAVLLESKATKERCWFIVWHAPRKKLDWVANQAVINAVIDLGIELNEATGHPVIALGDSNNREHLHDFYEARNDSNQRAGYTVGTEADVLSIIGLGIHWLQEGRTRVNWSDHFAIRANGVAE